MKTNVIQSPTIASEGMEASTMGMSTKGIDIASYFLRDKIYSKKVLAVVREYICNALDETVKYNVQKPVEVKIELIDGQYIWSVRDHAKGLSEHGIRNIFGMYFESTKSNDNNSIGGFGIGSKSAMSYTDTFYITSHFEGTCTKYCATLGGGQTGVPVGQIYKISEDPTTESGIEISLDIAGNKYEFMDESIRFIRSLPPTCNIIFSADNITHTPDTPKFQEQLGDYTLSLYDQAFEYGHNSGVAIRMGGVVYEYKRFQMDIESHKGFLVIDVPIGKLSIPISRESLEKTPTNEKIMVDIQKQLDIFISNDKTKLTVPNFKDTLPIINRGGYEISTDWFYYSTRQYFPQTYDFTRIINKSKWVYIPEVNGKIVVYLFPNIKNINNWKERLHNGLKILDPNFDGAYYWIVASEKNLEMTKWNETIDLSDVVFIDVKKMGLPKLEKTGDQTGYLVFKNCYKQGSYTPEGYEEMISSKFNSEYEDNWWEKATTFEELNLRTIGLVSDYGTGRIFHTANSKKMVEGLLELGWILPSSDEYKNRAKEIEELIKIERLKANAEYYVRDTVFNCSKVNPLVVRAVAKSEGKLTRLKTMRDKIKQENSLRGKILRNLYSSNNFNRQELRQILKLK